ncbi:MAG TPA: hypothetical protein DIU15_03600 [Deltaproteobacteria bacterium]|nr:hypothetical protein [Deltaproteobacteria bacterium]HCP45098.1 hypothetical protein [Deltaproteobacteria bacterium]
MVDLPRGVPFIDLLVPPGSGPLTEDIQTRIDLLDGGNWRVVADDGEMERSSLPMQPVRGGNDRYWIYRQQPFRPGESFEAPVSLCLEVARQSQASCSAAGVAGLYAWAFVLFEDIHYFHGLLLLDWLYNPRLSASGEVLESEDPEEARAELEAKVGVFTRLWTKQRSQALGARLPPGAIHEMDGLQAVSLLGPGGSFDPRFWQAMAMQLVLPQVRALAAAAAGEAPPPQSAAAGEAASSSAAPGAAVHAGAAAAPMPGQPPQSSAPSLTPGLGSSAMGAAAAVSQPPPPPSDGLTPLARAERAAREQALKLAEAGSEALEPEPADQPEPTGPLLVWRDGPQGPVVWVPSERYDDGILRELRAGQRDALPRGERPGSEVFDRWIDSGAHFVTEVTFLSRLFLDNTPLHKAGFDEACDSEGPYGALDCHLPRVAPVRAVLVPPSGDTGRRILVSSNKALTAADVVGLTVP